MSSHDVLVKEDDIDVAGLISALRKNIWLIMLITIITGIILFFVLRSIAPKYLSTAEVLIKTKASSAVEQIQEGNNTQINNRIDEIVVRTEVEILGSDRIAIDVIDELGLINIDEFQDDTSLADDLSDYIDAATNARNQSNPSSISPEELTVDDINRSTALRIFRENLEVFAIENTQVIKIEFSSENPALARNIVDAITKRYKDTKVTETNESVALASDFVNPRIQELRTLIQQERNAVAKFESDNQIFKTNNGIGDNAGLLVNQELSETSTELSRLRAERSAAQAKIASIRAALKSGSSIDVIPEVLESNYIQNLRQSEIAIQGQISELSTSLLPQHPEIKALNSQLQRYQSQIRKATQDIIKSLENNVSSTLNTEKKLSQEIDQLKTEQLKVNGFLVELDGMQKNISAYEEELQQRLSDSQQVRSRADIPPAAANIISPASIPDEPYFPKVVPFTLAGMTATAVLSVLGVIAFSLVTTVHGNNVARQDAEDREYANNTHSVKGEVKPAKQNRKKSGTLNELEGIILGNLRSKKLAEAPSMETPVNDDENESDDNIIAARYAASVLSDMGKGRVVVVSPGGDAGSKTTSMLARLLSSPRRKTIVIDMSGGLATTQEMLKSRDVVGIFNILNGEVPVENAIFTDHSSKAHVLSAGQLEPNAPMPDIYSVGEAIDAIAASYDFCIVDCGDANLDGIDIVSTDDAVIVISAINADVADCNLLERDLKADGYKDILQIIPDAKDVQKEATVRV